MYVSIQLNLTQKKFDKQIDSNVMMGSKGLDEGVDL